jgi:hypothetical protein
MAKRITNFAALVEITSAFLNSLQDLVLGAKKADSNNDLSALGDGLDARIWQASPATGVAAFDQVKVDTTLDWRDRLVWGVYLDPGALANLVGQASDTMFTTAGFATVPTLFAGYTGTGGYANISAGTPPSAGNPPVTGTADANRSYRVEPVAATAVFLYAHPTNGALYLFNNTSSVIQPVLLVIASGDTGKR